MRSSALLIGTVLCQKVEPGVSILPENLAIIWGASAPGPSLCQHCGPIKMNEEAAFSDVALMSV